jgi:hypothetical protein
LQQLPDVSWFSGLIRAVFDTWFVALTLRLDAVGTALHPLNMLHQVAMFFCAWLIQVRPWCLGRSILGVAFDLCTFALCVWHLTTLLVFVHTIMVRIVSPNAAAWIRVTFCFAFSE